MLLRIHSLSVTKTLLAVVLFLVAVDAVGAVLFQAGAGLLYAMSTTLEETLELIGVTLFIDALLRLRAGQSGSRHAPGSTVPPAGR